MILRPLRPKRCLFVNFSFDFNGFYDFIVIAEFYF